MLRKEIISTLIGLAIFGALTGLLLEVMIEGDAAKFKQFAEKIKGNTLILFETAQMATVENMISNAELGFELSTTQIDPDMISNTGDEYILNQVSNCVFSSPEDIPFSTCLICQLSDQECIPKVMCPECEIPTLFTVRYDNPTHSTTEVRIEVYEAEGDIPDPNKILAEFDGVMDGDEITIDGRDFNGINGMVNPNTVYHVILTEVEQEAVIVIDTSCSQDLFIGDVHLGDFGVSLTVISGTDADGNPTIHDETCEETGEQSEVNVLVEGKKILDNGYVAGSRETISLPTGPEHPQNDIQAVHCAILLVCGQEDDCPCEIPTLFTVRYDNPTHSTTEVRIEVYEAEGDIPDPNKILAEFDGVMDGDEITIDGRDFNGINGMVNPNTVYHVILTEVEQEAVIVIDTSCSQDLFIGDVHLGDFGVSLTVISGTDANLNPTIPEASCRMGDGDNSN